MSHLNHFTDSSFQILMISFQMLNLQLVGTTSSLAVNVEGSVSKLIEFQMQPLYHLNQKLLLAKKLSRRLMWRGRYPANSLTWWSSLCHRPLNMMRLTGGRWRKYCPVKTDITLIRLERIVASKTQQVENLVKINSDNLVSFDVMSVVLSHVSSKVGTGYSQWDWLKTMNNYNVVISSLSSSNWHQTVKQRLRSKRSVVNFGQIQKLLSTVQHLLWYRGLWWTIIL